MSASDQAPARPVAATVITPDWPAPGNVRALMTTRQGASAWRRLAALTWVTTWAITLPRSHTTARWCAAGCPPSQVADAVHGTVVAETGGCAADASVSRGPGEVSVIMTADCLPALFCDRAGTVVAAAHAGWRGLCDGVLEATVASMGVAPDQILVWLGAAIGPQQFEVGEEVRTAFMARDAHAATAFVPGVQPGKWLADIYQLARLRLAAVGVTAVYGGDLCTVSDAERFFSYRRDQQTGRMAALIWLD